MSAANSSIGTEGTEAMVRTYTTMRRALRETKKNCHEIGDMFKTVLGKMRRPRHLPYHELWTIPNHVIFRRTSELNTKFFTTQHGHRIYIITLSAIGHAFFCNSSAHDYHTVVVERFDDHFRIYQSWVPTYTFDQWIDCPENATGYAQACRSFGSSRILDMQQMYTWVQGLAEVAFFHERIAATSTTFLGAPVELMSTGHLVVEEFAPCF
jgi:hypothetical protein